MKILLVPSWYPQNSSDMSGSFFRTQAMALAEEGHEVTVFAIHLVPIYKCIKMGFRPLRIHKEEDGKVSTWRVVSINFFPGILFLSLWWRKRIFLHLYRKYIEEGGAPDIIHAHAALWGGWLITRSGNFKEDPPALVVTEHTSGYAQGRIRNRQCEMAREVYEKVDSVIFVSEVLRGDVEKATGADLSAAHIVPNPVAKQFFENVRSAKTQGGDASPIFVNVAGLTSIKNQQMLINAFCEVQREFPLARLWLVGDGPEKKALIQTARKMGVESSVVFFGKKAADEIPSLLRKADVYVLSSNYESFGVAAVEALSSGLPVVATRCGGPQEIVWKEDGALVAVGDQRALARQMLFIAKNLEKFDPKVISRRAFGRFSSCKIMKRLKEIYLECRGPLSR